MFKLGFIGMGNMGSAILNGVSKLYNKDDIVLPLSFEFRKKLISLLNKEVLHQNKKYTIEYSVSLLIKSYIKSFSTGEIKLDLPTIIYEQ